MERVEASWCRNARTAWCTRTSGEGFPNCTSGRRAPELRGSFGPVRRKHQDPSPILHVECPQQLPIGRAILHDPMQSCGHEPRAPARQSARTSREATPTACPHTAGEPVGGPAIARFFFRRDQRGWVVLLKLTAPSLKSKGRSAKEDSYTRRL